jgi:spore photoproduct lyase
MNHILITTALQAEAEPIVKQYQLEKKHLSENLFYFQRDDITCLTTGVGEKNVRKRLSTFLHKMDCKNTILFNIGIAGGEKNATEIGKMYLVNKIVSEKNGNIFLPENWIKTDIPVLPLTTVLKGVTDGGKQYEGLVDMEAAAIYETATKFIPAKHLYFLKVVSDYMEQVLDSPEQVLPLITNNLSEIIRFIDQIRKN